MTQEEAPLRDLSLIVPLVVLVHVMLLWFLATTHSLPRPVRHEMSVSIMPSAPQAAQVQPRLEEHKLEEPRRAPPAPVKTTPVIVPATPVATATPILMTTPASTPAAPAAISTPAVIAAAPVEAVEASSPPNATPVAPDREPDYRAAYLNNPPPAYPMVARRMGWQGRVVLNVEVLASGLPGEVKLHQGSGHDVLDNAAIQAVRGWKFTAARQGGQVVSKWFLVPIPFILKED